MSLDRPPKSPEERLIARLKALASVEMARSQVPSSLPAGQDAAEAFVRGLHRGLEGGLIEASEEGSARGAESSEPTEPVEPFEHEGLGAAAMLLDELAPGPVSRLPRLLAREADRPAVAVLLATGAGWALARLGRKREALEAKIPAPLRPSAEDGYAFQRALSHAYLFENPRRFGPATEAFDQGLGRALWFLRAADPPALLRALLHFDAARREALLRGLGVAAAFTGGLDREALEGLGRALEEADLGLPAALAPLEEGVGIGAALREALGPAPAHTALASSVFRA